MGRGLDHLVLKLFQAFKGHGVEAIGREEEAVGLLEEIIVLLAQMVDQGPGFGLFVIDVPLAEGCHLF